MDAVDVLRLATQVTYLGCFVVSLRALTSSRSQQARWLVVVFASLASVIVVGLIRGVDADPLPYPWSALLILVLIAFPWGLFRFALSLTSRAGRLRRAGDGASLALALFTLVPSAFGAEPGEALTTVQALYLGLFLLVWGAQTFTAAVVLFRGRRGQARVVQRRLRLLAIATTVIGLALFASVGGGSDDPEDEDGGWGQVAGQGLGALSGVLFLIGFAPPRLLRSAWRHDDERALYNVAVQFLSVTSPEEVVGHLLPGIRATLGAPAVALLDANGRPVAIDGSDETDWIEGARRLKLHDRDLAVGMSTQMPLIGEDEAELIDRLGLLTALATDRARLIVSEQQARLRLEDANERLESLNTELEAFLYSTSHDLKNPVIALIGYVDLLRTDHAEQLPAEAQRYLERLDANAAQIEALLNDLLELSRVGRVEAPASPVDLEAVIDGIAADLGQRHPDARVERGDLPTVTMSPQRVTQLFSNLLHNACLYGGRDDVVIQVTAEGPGDRGLEIRVEDNGAGIPQEYADRIFGMFERLDPEASTGTGMGLAICRRIVEHVGGSIVLDSNAQGAAFVIRLPAELVTAGHASSDAPAVALEST